MRGEGSIANPPNPFGVFSTKLFLGLSGPKLLLSNAGFRCYCRLVGREAELVRIIGGERALYEAMGPTPMPRIVLEHRLRQLWPARLHAIAASSSASGTIPTAEHVLESMLRHLHPLVRDQHRLRRLRRAHRVAAAAAATFPYHGVHEQLLQRRWRLEQRRWRRPGL